MPPEEIHVLSPSLFPGNIYISMRVQEKQCFCQTLSARSKDWVTSSCPLKILDTLSMFSAIDYLSKYGCKALCSVSLFLSLFFFWKYLFTVYWVQIYVVLSSARLRRLDQALMPPNPRHHKHTLRNRLLSKSR